MVWTSYPVSRLQGEIVAPGDKSCSHRAFIFSALAKGKSKLSGILESDDVLRTAEAYAKLGANVQKIALGQWTIEGLGELYQPNDSLDFGNSGTGCRLTLGAIAGFPITARANGDVSLRSRPMNRIINPLSKMGVAFESNDGRLPLMIKGKGNLSAINHRSKVASAQVKSAILIAGLQAEGETIVEEAVLTRDHTERMLSAFGGISETHTDNDGFIRIRLQGRQTLFGNDTVIPGDPSSAAFIVACGLLGESRRILVSNVMLNPTRCGFYEIIKQMGGRIEIVSEEIVGGESVGTFVVESSELRGVKISSSIVASMIDEFPILAVLASFAKGETVVANAEELRVKESDRISAIVDMLRVNGIEVDETDDGFIVQGCNGSPKGGGLVKTAHDHRIGMSALVMGTATQNPVSVDDISMIATSYPSFLSDLDFLGANLQGENH